MTESEHSLLPSPTQLSIAPIHTATAPQSESHPRTFDQSDSDVIAKVAVGCYIPEAVVVCYVADSFGT